jgi:hypothetical protein
LIDSAGLHALFTLADLFGCRLTIGPAPRELACSR